MFTIREAVAADAERLSELACSTFTDTFMAQNNPEDIKVHCERYYQTEIQRQEIQDVELTTFVVDKGEDQFIAFAQVHHGQGKAGIDIEVMSEIKRFYVLPEAQGTGLAQQLMATCIECALASQSDGLWLGVWEQNPRAQRFYQKMGFEPAGEHIFLLGNDPQRDIIMVRHL